VDVFHCHGFKTTAPESQTLGEEDKSSQYWLFPDKFVTRKIRRSLDGRNRASVEKQGAEFGYCDGLEEI
jgi:hypothetical protein